MKKANLLSTVPEMINSDLDYLIQLDTLGLKLRDMQTHNSGVFTFLRSKKASFHDSILWPEINSEIIMQFRK